MGIVIFFVESLTVKGLRTPAINNSLAFFWQQAKQLDKKLYST